MLGQLHVRQGTAALALLVLTACNPASTARTAASPSPSSSPTALPACLDQPAEPAAPAGVKSSVPAWVVGSGLDQPDDLLYRDGVLYTGQLGAGKVDTWSPGHPWLPSQWTVPKAEGIAFLGDSEFVANQQDDTIQTIVSEQPQPFLQLTPVSGKDNVDGLGVQGTELLVPDSPNGNLLWVDGFAHVTRTVGGFNRPTGAWPLPDGSVLVADEYGNAVVKVAPDGSKSFLIQGLPIVDDVAADPGGHVFVVTPVVSGGRLAEVVDSQAQDLAGNLLEPQGLAFDDAGNVFVSESAAGRVDLFVRSFKIIPSAAPSPIGGTLCLHIQRAPGFTGAVTFADGPGVLVVRSPGTGDVGEVLVAVSNCIKGGCFVDARSGSLKDELWITR